MTTENTTTAYDIGEYEIHPDSPEDLITSINYNLSIARTLATEPGADVAGILDELRAKVNGALRYFFDNQ